MSIKVPAFLQKKLRITCRKIYSEGWQNCLVYGDEDRIVEVMQNLIENAVKYGNGGYLGIKSEDEEDCRLITVCNSGEGPGDDEMLHIFDSFIEEVTAVMLMEVVWDYIYAGKYFI